MVKPGLILPSERMNSICSLTNDGFGSYDDDGNLVLGDNDGKGNGSTFPENRSILYFIVKKILLSRFF